MLAYWLTSMLAELCGPFFCLLCKWGVYELLVVCLYGSDSYINNSWLWDNISWSTVPSNLNSVGTAVKCITNQLSKVVCGCGQVGVHLFFVFVFQEGI